METFYVGDCLEAMQIIPDNSVDLILTDPPFGITALEWDKVIDFKSLWKEYIRVSKPTTPIVLFSAQPFTTKLISSNLEMFKYCWVWLKNKPSGIAQANSMPMRYTEDLVVFYKKPPIFNKQMEQREGVGKDCYEYEHYCGNSNHVKLKKVKKFYEPDLVNPGNFLLFNTVPNRTGRLHPSQKPVELLEYLIKTYTNEGHVVLDSCMGSGSCGVACKNLKRDFIGIEKDSDYYKSAMQRVQNHTVPLL